MNKKRAIGLTIFILAVFCFTVVAQENILTPHELLSIKGCREAKISPDGRMVAYTVSVPRTPDQKPGSSYTQLYVMSILTKKPIPFITGEVSVGSISWSPDSTHIAFLLKRGHKAEKQVWMIPLGGGEAFQVTESKTGVIFYRWHPKGQMIGYTAVTASTEREKVLEKKGYKFNYYEENLKHRNLFLMDIKKKGRGEQLTQDVTVWDFEFSPDGKTIAAAVSEKNLVDHSYMFKKLMLLDAASKKLSLLVNPNAKLGAYHFSPDGSRITYTAALEQKDHAVSQVFVVDIRSKKVKNLTIPGFKGHVSRSFWRDQETVLYISGEGVWPTLSQVSAVGGIRKVLMDAKKTGISFRSLSFSKDKKIAVFVGNSPTVPGDIYLWRVGRKLDKLTRLNPWLEKKDLGRQDVVVYKARDGQLVEGLLMYPVGYKKGIKYPLVVLVHGGPESHHSNGWLSRYGSPGQVLAGKGYAVFYPNYRASTGYGVKFALAGYKDAAGVEFEDIADGIDFLVKEGIADKNRVGLGGGSYGGYAAAWFGSYYTEYVKGVCMFVGISDLISKRGTSDIPYEEMYVHSGMILEEMWDFALKRSPIYWAHQSRTAVLIIGGASDTRVHPSQSLEFFRRLKMNHHPAVRLVQYPGEGHGNRKQPGQIDVLFRILQWYDWYVKDTKPLAGPMPPLDISENYGLELKN